MMITGNEIVDDWMEHTMGPVMNELVKMDPALGAALGGLVSAKAYETHPDKEPEEIQQATDLIEACAHVVSVTAFHKLITVENAINKMKNG